jgi:hypothetical protein
VARVFLGAFAAGIVLALVGAALLPAPAPARYRALITVQPDGGRREEFLVRFPGDRIDLPADVRADPPPADARGAVVLEDAAGQRASAELFRLRDADGNVIGVASRVALGGGGTRPSSTWMLVIPGRGTLAFGQEDAADLTARQRPGAARRVASLPQQAAFWAGFRRYVAGADGALVHGTREFAGLTGRLTETWTLAEAGADGSARGEIRLVTLTRGAE